MIIIKKVNTPNGNFEQSEKSFSKVARKRQNQHEKFEHGEEEIIILPADC
tara:strand:- start:285 stop:434 length:150 start_codon:yes stop_codon:yes gene_type:complete